MIYERRIIDEREADRIYTQYHEILMNKKAAKEGTASMSDTNNDESNASGLSGSNTPASDQVTTQSNAQWKKDETMLLQYIILNVADQRDTLVENFSD